MVIQRRAHTARLLVLTGLISLVGVIIWLGARRPAILIVHSQNERIPWTQGIDAGIDRIIQPASAVRLQRIYLQGQDSAQIAEQVQQTSSFIERWRPDVLMVIDDLAQARIGATYASKGTPAIVYSGIEDHERTLAKSPMPQVQGIAERTPWPIVENSLLRLARLNASSPASASHRPRIALISDTGPAAEEEALGFAQHVWHSAQPIGMWRCASLEQWLLALDEIAKRADIVVIGDYRYLQVPESYSALAWRRRLAQAALQHLSQPMTALSAYAVADGIPMGILPSPVEQGEVAAQMALQVVHRDTPQTQAGIATSHPQHAQTQNFALLLNNEQMTQRELTVDALDAYYARVSSRLIGNKQR